MAASSAAGLMPLPVLAKNGFFVRGRKKRAGILFGASASKEIFDNPAYADLYRAHARVLTTDVALKFDYIRWKEGKWDFSEADRLLGLCQQHNQYGPARSYADLE